MTRKEIRHHIYTLFSVHLTSIYLYKEKKNLGRESKKKTKQNLK
jgi:hypothetical protein